MKLRRAKGATRWELADLVASSEQFAASSKQVRQELAEIAAETRKLVPGVSTKIFTEVIAKVEKLEGQYHALAGYAELRVATDQKDSEGRLLQAKLRDLAATHAEALRPLWRWCKGLAVEGMETLDETNAARLFAAVPKLSYTLSRMRALAHFSRSEPEERILTNKDLIAMAAITDLRTQIETEQTYTVKIPGKKPRVYKTQAELTRLTQGASAPARRGAYDALLSVYQKQLTKYTTIYGAVAKDWDTEAKLRGYASPISMMNMYNDLSDKSVETLLTVVAEEREVFQKFFRLKVKILGMRTMSRYDLYAPIKQRDGEREYSQSLQTVFATFAQFSPRFAAYARKIVDDKHVDSHPRPGKQSGAFCMPTPAGITPYVLLNYMGGSRDTLVVAHELGHGVHDQYASQQSPLAADPPLPLAETASTFGELLVFEALYHKETDREARKELLLNRLSETYATILRQAYFVKFEQQAHRLIMETGATGEQLADLWYQTLIEQFDGVVKIPKQFRYEWAYIPHIVHTPFYCYAYVFGGLLTMSLYEKYRAEGESFVSKIEAILSAGGAENPRELLRSVGMDIEDPEFWRGGFSLVKRWVRELAELS